MNEASTARVFAGRGTVIIGPGVVAVIGAPLDHDVSAHLAGLWRAGRLTWDAIVDALVDRPVRSLPSFAILSLGISGGVALLRGDIGVDAIDGAGNAVTLRSEGSRTWNEVAIPVLSGAALGPVGLAADPLGWVASGCVEGGACRWGDHTLDVPGGETDREPTESVSERPQPLPLRAPPSSVVIAAEDRPAYGLAPVAPDDDAPDAEPLDAEPPDGPEQTAPDDPALAEDEADNPPDAGVGAEVRQDPPQHLPGATQDFTAWEHAQSEAPSSAVPSGFDHLFDKTRVGTVEQAAVRGEPAPAGPGDPVPASAPAPANADSTGLGDHDGRTRVTSSFSVDDASQAVPDQVGRPAGGGGARRVAASRCGEGHPNPPYSSICRCCGASVLPGVEQIERPSVGVLVGPGGSRTDVDRTVLIGRRPGGSMTSGGEPPRTLTIDDPHLSRTHCIIEVAEWVVTVADQNSQNGTIVRAPGQPPHRLRSGERVTVIPGAEVVLADEVVFRFEAC